MSDFSEQIFLCYNRVPVAPSSVPILLSGVNCSGSNDLSLLYCPHDQTVSNTCDHSLDVYLTCAGPYSISKYCNSAMIPLSCRFSFIVACTEPGSVRLIPRNYHSANSYFAGRVEVFYNGRWGTVCSRNTNGATADKLCTEATSNKSSVALTYGSAGQIKLRYVSIIVHTFKHVRQ